jgi:opacity protein-like surface antigen
VRQSGDEWSRFTGTINAFYDFSPLAGLTHYVGAADDRKTAGVSIGSTENSFTSKGGSSTEGLALLEAGASVPLTDALSVTASYRYVHFFAAGEDIAHILKLGVRYSF